MILASMIYATAVTLLVAVAGRALEHALRALEKPVRFVSLAMMVVATSIAAVSLVSSAHDSTTATASQARRSARHPLPHIATPAASPLAISTWSSLVPPRSIAMPNGLAMLDAPLLVMWIVASLVWAAILSGSAVRLRRQRATWREDMVDGAPVYISHDVGPALFGVFRYSVVVPRWVIELGAEQRTLVLAHEREHARAGDPLLLVAGALLVLVQPWNAGMWFLFERLRFAIEVDCDRRVIKRSFDLRTYGELLVDIGERMLPGAAPVVALSEPHSHLDRRITTMTTGPASRPVLRTIVGSATASVLLIAACQVPRPAASSQSLAPSMPNDFVQYRWVVGDAPANAALGEAAPTLGDTVVLDLTGIESAFVSPDPPGVDSTWIAVAKLNVRGAAAIGAATATHIGHRIAVTIDGKVSTVAIVETPLGASLPLTSDVSRAYADSIAQRVNRAANALRPMQPVVFQRERRALNQNKDQSGRTVVKITRVGLSNTANPPAILVYTTGQALVGIGNAAPAELRDTLRLSSLPAMTLDVTDGDVHLQLLGGGTMRVDADVIGGRAIHFSGEGRHLTVLWRGMGIRTD